MTQPPTTQDETPRVLVHMDLFGYMQIAINDNGTWSKIIVPPSAINSLVTQVLSTWSPDKAITIRPAAPEVQGD